MNVTDSNNTDFRPNAHQNKHFFRSMIFRVFALMLLLALMLIPLSMLESLVDDHIKQEQTVLAGLTNNWGNPQTIIGPILSIPYVERISRIESQTDSKGVKSSVSKDIFNNKTLMLLPENLSITANLKDKVLTQDKYQTNVYQGEVSMSGNYNLDALPEASGYNSIEWDKAFVSIGFNDNKSVEASTPLRWEGSSAKFKPGTQLPMLPKLLKQGFHANLEDVATENTRPKFRIQLNLKGVQSLQFAPLGELTSIKISSDSVSTKVGGDIPASSKVSSVDGFEASWRISNLSRNYPQQWLIEDDKAEVISYDFSSVLTGIGLDSNTTTSSANLAKIKNSLTYIILILGIIFLSLLILEFKRNSRSKPKFIHYLVIASAVLIVPLLLLTLSHSMSFIQAYQLAAGVSMALIVLFAVSILKSFTQGFYLLLVLATLFAAQFVIIEMPEFALFAISAAGIVITTLLMIVSFNIKEDY